MNDKLFRGYIPSNGKIPHYSLNKGDLLQTPPDGDYVGVLKSEYIQVDFDNAVDKEVVLKIVEDYKLKCDILETTRGVHLYFKTDNYHQSQAVHSFTALGLMCDIGLGEKNRVVPLRTTKEEEVKKIINGREVLTKVKKTKERDWLQTYDELEVLPPYFRVIGKTDPKFRDSESRNQTLFDYILKLQFVGFSQEECRKTLKVVNKYMLYESLSDKELDTITREDAFSQELFFDEKGRFLHDRFGDYLLSNGNIITLDKIPHIYTKEHVYQSSPAEFEKVMLSKIKHIKDAQRKEVYKYISLRANHKGVISNPSLIAVRDGILDIRTDEILPFSPKYIITNKADWSYNPSAYHELMDTTLNKICCGHSDLRMLIEEMIGYTLYRKNTMQSAFILTGEGSNGKSTFLNLIKKLLGKENYTSLELQDLEDQYKPADMHNKLANIGDDISSKYMENSSIFKKVVTGESFVVRKIYQEPFEMSCYATQIFCANTLPQVNDKSDGFTRRLIIVPFNAKFSKLDEDYNPFIEEDLTTEDAMEYLLKIAIDGLKRLLVNREFTKTELGEREKQQYLVYNDNVLEYLSEEPKIQNESVADVYMRYSVWCAQNGTHPVKKIGFSKAIQKHAGYESKTLYIDQKSVKAYVKKD